MIRLLLNGTAMFHSIVSIILDFILMCELHIYFVGLILGPLCNSPDFLSLKSIWILTCELTEDNLFLTNLKVGGHERLIVSWLRNCLSFEI
jgi:hypothetical protein